MGDGQQVYCRNFVAGTLRVEGTTGKPSEKSNFPAPILAEEATEVEVTTEIANGQKTVDHNELRKLSSESQDTAESKIGSERNVKVEEHGKAGPESANNVGNETPNSPGLNPTTTNEIFKTYGTGDSPDIVQNPLDGGNQESNSKLKRVTDGSIHDDKEKAESTLVKDVSNPEGNETSDILNRRHATEVYAALINKDYKTAELSDNCQTLVEGDQRSASGAKGVKETSDLGLVEDKLDEENPVEAGSITNSELNETSDSSKFTPPTEEVYETADIIKGPKAFDETGQKLSSELQGSAESDISCGKNSDEEEAKKVATSNRGNGARKKEKLLDVVKDQKRVEDAQEQGSDMPGAENSSIGFRKLDSPNLTLPEFPGADQKHFVENDEEITSEVQHDAQSVTASEVSGKDVEESKVGDCSTSSKLVKPSSPTAFENLATSNEVRTLEDCLEAFGMFPRLLQLDESLEEVRRYRNTAKEHEMECERLDKDLQRLSLEYHPDRVMQRGGTEEEKTRTKELQAALNATRTVLKTLSKIFLEDLDIEHKYEFYTKLDIGLLGNEDEVEKHAYQVLFNISLISEIKQGTIIGDIRRFLSVAQKCVRHFPTSGMYFTNYRNLAFSYLERCVDEYRKLYAEHDEVEMQCRKENLSNIYPTIHKMKRDCSMQLKHLESLLELSKRPFGELFPMYSSTFPVDDYLVLPFVCYTNVILSCSLMHKSASEEHKEGGWFSFQLPSFGALLGKTTKRSSCHFDLTSDDVSLLYQLALCYGGNAEYTRSVKEIFGWQQASREIVRGQFLETLEYVRMDLERRFKINDYVVKNCKMHILKELKVYRRVTSEITEKTRGFEDDLEEINRNNDYMRRRLDEVMRNQSEVSNELNELGEMSRRTSPNQN